METFVTKGLFEPECQNIQEIKVLRVDTFLHIPPYHETSMSSSLEKKNGSFKNFLSTSTKGKYVWKVYFKSKGVLSKK